MASIEKYQILAPADWQDFEKLCRDLWRAIWDDPGAPRTGCRGSGHHFLPRCPADRHFPLGRRQDPGAAGLGRQVREP